MCIQRIKLTILKDTSKKVDCKSSNKFLSNHTFFHISRVLCNTKSARFNLGLSPKGMLDKVKYITYIVVYNVYVSIATIYLFITSELPDGVLEKCCRPSLIFRGLLMHSKVLKAKKVQIFMHKGTNF